MPPAVSEMPLPFSVSLEAIEPTIVTSSPSRIQTVPRPPRTSQWKRAQGRRSSRAGIAVSMVSSCATIRPLVPGGGDVYAWPVLACRLLGHRYRFTRDGRTMTWTCERCGSVGGTKVYETPAEAEAFARAFDREDRKSLG